VRQPTTTLSRIGDASLIERVAAARATYTRADQRVTMYAVNQGGHTVYTDAPSLSLAGRRVTTRYAVRGFHFEPIEYRATVITGAVGARCADVRPTLTSDQGHGVGTDALPDCRAPGRPPDRERRSRTRRGRGAGSNWFRFRRYASERIM
jgi:hypothetical protein